MMDLGCCSTCARTSDPIKRPPRCPHEYFSPSSQQSRAPHRCHAKPSLLTHHRSVVEHHGDLRILFSPPSPPEHPQGGRLPHPWARVPALSLPVCFAASPNRRFTRWDPPPPYLRFELHAIKTWPLELVLPSSGKVLVIAPLDPILRHRPLIRFFRSRPMRDLWSRLESWIPFQLIRSEPSIMIVTVGVSWSSWTYSTTFS
jgi:hypothetical protein